MGSEMQLIGKCISEIRARSFYIERQIICECTVIFIALTDDHWLSITVSEGEIQIVGDGHEPELTILDEISDDFAYPVLKLNGFEMYFGKKITEIFSYKMLEKKEDIYIGLYIECGDIGFSICEIDDCLSVSHGKNDDFLQIAYLDKLSFP
jgi:hypothetical protein